LENNYGQRIRGYITAPVTGRYRFWLTSDNESELYLSPSSDPNAAVRVARVFRATQFHQWNKEPEQSARVNLIAGERYYFEILHKEGIGNDHLSVGWLKPGENGNTPSEVVPGSVLTPFVAAP
jgi:hypothetical protein